MRLIDSGLQPSVIARSPKGDEAIQEAACAALDCFASLAMTCRSTARANHSETVSLTLYLLEQVVGAGHLGLAGRVLDVDALHHAVIDHHGIALGAHAEAVRRRVE